MIIKHQWPNGPPNWITEADRGLKAWGEDHDVLITKAMLLGMKAEPYNNGNHPTSKWVHRDEDHGGLVGETLAQLAFRYLYSFYHNEVVPEHVRNTCPIMDRSRVTRKVDAL